MYCDQRSQYIRPNSKNNSFRGNYSRKYGIQYSWQNSVLEWKIVDNEFCSTNATSRPLFDYFEKKGKTRIQCTEIVTLRISSTNLIRTYKPTNQEARFNEFWIRICDWSAINKFMEEILSRWVKWEARYPTIILDNFFYAIRGPHNMQVLKGLAWVYMTDVRQSKHR